MGRFIAVRAIHSIVLSDLTKLGCPNAQHAYLNIVRAYLNILHAFPNARTACLNAEYL